MIRETINRSFSIKIILKSEVKNIDLEIKNEKVDKGEEILKSIVKDDILRNKGYMKKNKINNKKDYDIIIKYRKNFKGGF